MMAMPFVASFILLSITGLLISGFLIRKHYLKQKQPLVCPLNHDCSVVAESKWSHIFYVRNEVLGFLFYAALLVGMVMALFLPQLVMITKLILVATAGGLFFSLFLIFVQVKVIKDYCFYCLLSAGISLMLFVNSFALL